MLLTDPVLWRGPGELQVGVTSPRVLAGLSAGEVELIQHLTCRRSPEWLAHALAQAGVSPARWAELRAQLDGERPDPPAPRRGPVLLLDSHPLTVRAGHLLAGRGVRVVTEERGRAGRSPDLARARPALAVLTDAWVSDPVRTAPLLRHDVAHLPIVVDDGVTIGPTVVPGSSACTRCLELARTDADPAWPAVATQLRLLPGRPVPEPELAAGLVAWAAAGFLGGASPRGWRLADGWILPVAVAPHPRCGCLTPPSADAPDPA